MSARPNREGGLAIAAVTLGKAAGAPGQSQGAARKAASELLWTAMANYSDVIRLLLAKG